MPELIEVATPSGPVLFAVAGESVDDGQLEPAGLAEEALTKLRASIDDARATAVAVARGFVDAASEAGSDSIDVEVGLNFSAKGKVYVVEAGIEASIKVKFSFPARNQRDNGS